MKAMVRLLAVLIFVGSLAVSNAQAPTEILNELAVKVSNSISNRAKIYVVTDKSTYQVGTTIHLKVFLLQESTNLLYTGKEPVYLELIDQTGILKSQIIFEPNDRELEGGINLPSNLNPGIYYLRAYTEDQAKRTTKDIFYKPIAVLNQGNSTKLPATTLYFNPDQPITRGTHLYPEGNSLINGVSNLVVVQHMGTDGLPKQVSGFVKDSRDSIVARFQTNEFGLGNFSFIPFKGRKYSCFINEPSSGSPLLLPEAAVQAYQLALIKNESNYWQFRIGLSDLLYSHSPETYLIAVSKGKVCFAANGKGMYLVQVPKEKFSEGVAEFFLFNAKQELVSRRAVVMGKPDKLVTVIPDKKQYFARATAKLDVSVIDSPAKNTPALLTVTITDDQFVDQDPFPHMSQFFLLKKLSLPPLRTALKESTLDFASIIYSSTNELAAILPTATEEQNKGFYLTGAIENTKGAIAKQAVSLMSDQQKSILLFDTTDDQGGFSFGPLRYFDSTHFLLHPDGKSISVKDWKLNVRSEFGNTTLASIAELPSYSNEQLERAINRFQISYPDSLLAGAYKGFLLRGAEKKISAPPTQAAIKRNKFSKFITREELSKLDLSTTVNAVLMIPGVRNIGGKIVLRGGTPALDASLDQNIEPLVVVDGVPAPVGSGGVASYLNSIPPDLIEYIEVLLGGEAAAYATRGINGVIIIKTGLPNDRARPSDNILDFYPRGFHVPPVFAQPNYADESIKEANFNDNRSTIFWSTNLLTDDKGNVKVQFFTADKKSTYTVTITGINAKGEFIHQLATIRRE